MIGRSRRRGFAVAVALYMLAAVAGLAAASFYAVVEARRAANRSTRQEQAAGAADAGLHAVLEAWDVAKRDSMPVGGVDSSAAIPPGVRSVVIRLTPSIYWIASVGEAAVGTSVEARRAHNLVVETRRPRFQVQGALVSRGSVVGGRGVTIDGRDAVPPTWTDCPPRDSAAVPSIVLPPGASATFEDSGPIPGAEVDSTAGAISSYRFFGRVAVSALAGRSTLTVAPGAILSPAPDIGRDCELDEASASPGSWGEPVRTGRSAACERFYPVVHALGDLVIKGGRGQGILIVSGRLRIEGPFLFDGVILAESGIDVSGSDVRIYGAVTSAAAAGVVWRAEGELRRSGCAVQRVSDAAAKAFPIPLRAWSELF